MKGICSSGRPWSELLASELPEIDRRATASTAGGATGLCLACLTLPLLIHFAPENLPRTNEIGLNWRMASFVAGVTLVTSLLFCLMPFVNTMGTLAAAQLGGQGRTTTQGKRERLLTSGSVIVQFSLAFILLATARLLVRSLIARMKPIRVANRSTS